MPPTKAASPLQKKKQTNAPLQITYNLYEKYLSFDFLKYLIFNPAALPLVSALILAAELVLNVIVIWRVPYTEIDWKAYMQECEGFLNGTTNYALLKGDTGPLVYPAGFVYIYSAFYFITSHGQNIRLAQYIFAGIYLLQMCLVLRLYSKSRKVPPYVLVISAFTSYRIHSIYVLRLFNDPIAVLFLYAALNLFVDRKWTLGSLCFSLGVAVKMNILLFAPALLLFYLMNLGCLKTILQLSVCAGTQLILGLPFLLTYPLQYLKGSFDLGRIFEHKWTVNYRFLSRDVFENTIFHMGLLSLHLILLVIIFPPCYAYFKNYVRLRELQKQLQPQIVSRNREIKKLQKFKKITKKDKKNETEDCLTDEQQQFLDAFEKSLQKSTGLKAPLHQQSPTKEKATTETDVPVSIHFDQCTQLALLPFFICNLVGIMCARSLHYQFYVWYFHSLPYLTWSTTYSLGLRYLLLGLVEFAWNTYPSTNLSSCVLHLCHISLLFGVGLGMRRATRKSAEMAAGNQGEKNEINKGSKNRTKQKVC